MNSRIWQKLVAILRDCFEVLYWGLWEISLWILWPHGPIVFDMDGYGRMSGEEVIEWNNIVTGGNCEYTPFNPP